MSVDAIVLAGGAGRRFGSDKLAVVLDDRPLLHHALEACAAVADRIVLVVAPDAPLPELPASLNGRIVVARDEESFGGPLAGLAAGLGAVIDADLALVVGGDMPTLDPQVLRLLVARASEDPSCDAVTLESDPPVPLPMVIRPPAARPVARARLDANRRSLRALLDELRPAVVPASAWRALDPDARTLVDVDTEADLESLR